MLLHYIRLFSHLLNIYIVVLLLLTLVKFIYGYLISRVLEGEPTATNRKTYDVRRYKAILPSVSRWCPDALFVFGLRAPSPTTGSRTSGPWTRLSGNAITVYIGTCKPRPRVLITEGACISWAMNSANSKDDAYTGKRVPTQRRKLQRWRCRDLN